MKAFTLHELAALTGAKLIGNPKAVITGVAGLEAANDAHVSFLSDPKHMPLLKTTEAQAVFIHPEQPQEGAKNFLLTDDPEQAIECVIKALYQDFKTQSAFQGIHPTAIVHPSAKIGNNVSIGPYSVVDQGASIGDRTTIASHCTIGPNTTIGEDSELYPNVTIREQCKIGNRVTLQAGAVIGSCGFGYATDEKGRHQKQTQIGCVVLEDDVEIGSNTCVDRSRFHATVVSRGTKIDNLCNIAHNVHVGEDNIIVSQCGIAGSSKTGKHVIMGGQAGVKDHVTIGDNVILAAKAGVSKSIKEPGVYNGIPAQPIAEYNRTMVYFRRLPKIMRKLLRDIEHD